MGHLQTLKLGFLIFSKKIFFLIFLAHIENVDLSQGQQFFILSTMTQSHILGLKYKKSDFFSRPLFSNSSEHSYICWVVLDSYMNLDPLRNPCVNDCFRKISIFQIYVFSFYKLNKF